MAALRLIAFDLDDTLAPSKTVIDPRMAELLTALLDTAEVCVISGGNLEQFNKQVVTQLVNAPEALRERLHLMPTCGTQYYRFANGEVAQVYAEHLSEDEKSRAIDALADESTRLGLIAAETWGPTIQDRGSQITFSALGQHAPVDEKAAWDPSGVKKERLRAAVATVVPDLEVRSGGSTSIDITRRGIDKAYGMTRLSELTGIALSEMLFIGDRLDEGGNDYPVKALGVASHPVHGWEETAQFLSGYLIALRHD